MHYIAMAGLSGYLPTVCEAHDDYQGAVASLAWIHELGKTRTNELKRNGYVDLNLEVHGNEYVEIVECKCDNPGIHSDNTEEI